MDINASIRKISILERKISGANNNWHITLSYNNDIVEAKGSTVEEAWESALAFADVFLGYSVEYTCPFDDRGAILCWTFSNPASPVVSQLFIKLTESEAQKVSMTDLGSVGMLESVRMNLEETEAIMVTYMKRNESQTLVMPFHIKRDHSEEHLSRGLDATASFALDNLIRKPVLKIKTENDTFKRSKS